MRGHPYEFEEAQIIKAMIDAGTPGVMRIYRRVNEFRRQNGLPDRTYKAIADRVRKERTEPEFNNIFGSSLGYGPKMTPEARADAQRRRLAPRTLTAWLMGDPLVEDSALRRAHDAPSIARDALDFSDLEPEARWLARRQFNEFSGASA